MERQSILSRPRRQCSRANEEHLDLEYRREMAALEAKQRRYRETEEYLRRSRFGEIGVEDKAKVCDEFQQLIQDHAAHKREEQARTAKLDQQIAAESVKYAKAAEDTAAAREAKKREEARLNAEVNRRMAEEKRAQQQRERAIECQRERLNLEVLQSERRNYR